jgi:uncharacterized protein (TIGR02145 family)
MRKLLLTTAAVAAAIGLAFAAEPTGTFTDKRDGQTYRTVTIGRQTWMARNINYQTKSGSWCYDNNADNCKKYGRLYDWNTAKTVCPAGYHLPSRQEWNNLMAAAGGKNVAGKKLKTRNGWEKKGNGNDDFGFSALPSGYRRDYDDSFHNIGHRGRWWTAIEDRSGGIGNDYAYYRYMNHRAYVREHLSNKSLGYSVRCISDNP